MLLSPAGWITVMDSSLAFLKNHKTVVAHTEHSCQDLEQDQEI